MQRDTGHMWQVHITVFTGASYTPLNSIYTQKREVITNDLKKIPSLIKYTFVFFTRFVKSAVMSQEGFIFFALNQVCDYKTI